MSTNVKKQKNHFGFGVNSPIEYSTVMKQGRKVPYIIRDRGNIRYFDFYTLNYNSYCVKH